MRKLTAKDNGKRNRKFVVILGIFLVAIMLFSTVGYSFLSINNDNEIRDSSFIYNGFSFIENNGYFFTSIGGYDFAIRTDPRNIDGSLINGTIKTLNSYSGAPLYYNSEDSEALIEIRNNFGQIVLRMNTEACPGETISFGENLSENKSASQEFLVPILECDEEKNMPIKDCESSNVVIIEIKNKSSILQKDNCVFISGSEDEILSITDEFILKVLGILA